MYIINASVEEDKRSALISDLNKIITNQGGKVVKTDEWGMRDFAYRIDDMT
ncbi:MAG: 30S ribosomal protein S6, partial [Lactimicrobium massiliense]